MKNIWFVLSILKPSKILSIFKSFERPALFGFFSFERGDFGEILKEFFFSECEGGISDLLTEVYCSSFVSITLTTTFWAVFLIFLTVGGCSTGIGTF